MSEDDIQRAYLRRQEDRNQQARITKIEAQKLKSSLNIHYLTCKIEAAQQALKDKERQALKELQALKYKILELKQTALDRIDLCAHYSCNLWHRSLEDLDLTAPRASLGLGRLVDSVQHAIETERLFQALELGATHVVNARNESEVDEVMKMPWNRT